MGACDVAGGWERGRERERENLKKDAIETRDKRETEGRRDRWSEYQRVSIPKTTKAIVGFKINVLWQYPGEDGEPYLDWAHGKVMG